MISREDYILAVRMCIGTPVQHGGRKIGKCLDCVGVMWAACDLCGLLLEPHPRYGPLPSGDELSGGLSLFADRVERIEDAHALQVFVGRQPRHLVVPVGLDASGRIEIVHAWGKMSLVQLTTLTSPVAAAWRLRGVS